ncbi:hypothetical protein [Nocardia brasiliensis]|uniref:hypothetical protein n=1 Tax=Nocardia brasiliensis TaxID=37326 RepID=UPI00366A593F
MTLFSHNELIEHAPPRPPPATEHDSAAFTELGDRLVRNLFDTGLRLDTIRMAFDRDELTPAQVGAHRDAIVGILANLDSMIRTTSSAMLTLTSAAPMGAPRRKRRR